MTRREQVVSMFRDGATPSEIARRTGARVNTVYNHLMIARRSGELPPALARRTWSEHEDRAIIDAIERVAQALGVTPAVAASRTRNLLHDGHRRKRAGREAVMGFQWPIMGNEA